jgi:hypothetical protein
MKKINFEQVLKEVSKSIIEAKNRIYATHLLTTTKDIDLPIDYIKALQKTKCINKNRVVF